MHTENDYLGDLVVVLTVRGCEMCAMDRECRVRGRTTQLTSQQSFIIPLREKEIVTPQEVELLFGNWEHLIDVRALITAAARTALTSMQCNKHVVASLQTELSRPAKERDFGSIFLLAVDDSIENSFANLYSRYCANLALSDRCRCVVLMLLCVCGCFFKRRVGRI